MAAIFAAAACGGHHGGGSTTENGGTTKLAATDAARWIPTKATIAFTAPTLAHAQRGFRDFIDGIAVPVGESSSSLSIDIGRQMGIDIFSDSAVAAIGVDTESSAALFSDSVNPTLVVHLSDPERFQQYIDDRRNKGLHTTSVVVDGTEVYTTKDTRTSLAWAVVDDFLFLHVTFGDIKDDTKTWFKTLHGRGPSSTASPTWDWAKTAVHAPADGVVGFLDPSALLASVAGKLGEARACIALAAPVSRIAFGISGDGKAVSGRIAIDIGAAAKNVSNYLLAVPPGWDATTADAPLAVQWNVDLDKLAGLVSPCLQALDANPFEIAERYHVRGGRAILTSYDDNDPIDSSGVAMLDLTSKAYFEEQLDQIPMRSTLEKRRTYGAYAGASLSVPFGPTLEYVLNDEVAIAGLGEGSLAHALGTGNPAPGALARVDINVEAMPGPVWGKMLDYLDKAANGPDSYKGMAVASALVAWKTAHLVLSVEGSEVVLEADAQRR